MQIRVDLVANTAKAQAQYRALTAQVNAFNESLAASTAMSGAAMARANASAHGMQRGFANTLASYGNMRAETVRFNDVLDENTRKLRKQELTFRQTFGKKNRTLMRSMYEQQLAMRTAVATFDTPQSATMGNKRQTILGIPNDFGRELDNANNRLGFFSERLRSGSNELVKWGKNTQWAGRQLMAGISYPVAAFGAIAGVMTYQVDKELTRIEKVYDTYSDRYSENLKEQKAAEKELAELRVASYETAVKGAQAYGRAAVETLSVQAELAATGMTGKDLQANTLEVQRAASLGEIDAETATKSAITLRSVLRSTSDEIKDVNNYINAVENATSLTAEDFNTAMPIALGAMKQMSAVGTENIDVLQNMSLLLVGMKERGVDAAEGANAIKAMMGRLFRPSKQVRQEWEQLTGLDPLSFVKESGGDVMQILQRIGDATKNLSPDEQTQAFAGLFGVYQVTRMKNMIAGLQDLEEGVGQTARAFDVGSKSAEEWGKTADAEIETQAKSISGQFDRALETLKAELSQTGEVFLSIATQFLKFTSGLLNFFNGMPGWAKHAIMFTAVLVAIIGPIIMLIGLFANLAGNIGKFAGWFGTLRTGWNSITTAEIAQNAALQKVTAGFDTAAGRARIMEQSLNGVTAATYAAIAAMLQLNPAMMSTVSPALKNALVAGGHLPPAQQGTGSGTSTTAVATAANGKPVTNNRPMPVKIMPSTATAVTSGTLGSGAAGGTAKFQQGSAYAAGLASAMARPNFNAYTPAQQATPVTRQGRRAAARAAARTAAPVNTAATNPFTVATPTNPQVAAYAAAADARKKESRERRKENQAARKEMVADARATDSRAKRQAALNKTAWDRERKAMQQRQAIQQRFNGQLGIGAASTIAMAASMALMMGTSNETANNIGKWLMISAIVLPALALMKPIMLTMGASAVLFARSMQSAAVATMATARGATGAAGALAVAGAASKGILASVLAVIGPVGVVVAGIAAVAGIAYLVYRRATKEQREAEAAMKKRVDEQKNLNSLTDLWEKKTEEVASNYQNMSVPGNDPTAANSLQDEVDRLKSNEENKPKIDDFRAATTGDNAALGDQYAISEYIELVNNMGYSADEAQNSITALYVASGIGAVEATAKVNDLLAGVESLRDADAVEMNIWAETAKMADADTGDFRILEGLIADRGARLGTTLSDALARAESNPEQYQAILGNIEDAAYTHWSSIYDSIAASEDSNVKNFMAQFDIENMGDFRAWVREHKDDLDEYNTLFDGALYDAGIEGNFADATKFAYDYEKGMVGSLSKASLALDDNVDTVVELKEATNALGRGTSYEQFSGQIQGIQMGMGALNAEAQLARENAELMARVWGRDAQVTINAEEAAQVAEEAVRTAEASAKTKINAWNGANGFKAGATYAEALEMFLNRTTDPSAKVVQDMMKFSDVINGLPDNINFEITGAETTELYKSTMQSMQEQMADSAMESFDNRTNLWLDRIDRKWETARENLDKELEAQTELAEDNWDRQTEALEDYHDGRIEALDDEIKAEQEAEEIRQKIFDAERTRIQRLAEMQNRNIDFNIALRTGNLDEAARIGNDSQAATEGWALDDTEAAFGSASEQRQADLERQKEQFEEVKEAELKALADRQEQEKKYLDERQDQRRKNLEREGELERLATEKSIRYKRSELETKLELFKSYIARDQKDLERWMTQVGLSYDVFGGNVKAKGQDWSKSFGDTFSKEIRKNGLALASDKMWEKMGEDGLYNTLRGMGFMNTQSFLKFVQTGELPKTFGMNFNTLTDKIKGIPDAFRGLMGLGNTVTRHEGGYVGGGSNSRKGVARTTKGLGPGEQMVLARKKEFVVNERAAQRHGPLLEGINNGTFDRSPGNIGYGVGGDGGGPTGVVAAVAGKMISSAVTGMVGIYAMNMAAKALGEMAGAAGTPGGSGAFSGTAGEYGGRSFSSAQMQNAATIASVGRSMGMSGRDIQIGLMTALAESGLVNVNYGDRDSLGLFQQRPSQGWGTPEQVSNPEYASRKFFDALKRLSGRNDWTPWAAAQAVQRSAFADGSNYRAQWAAAQAIYSNGLAGAEIPKMLGSGGWAKPSIPGKGWSNTHDYRNGLNSPLYAHSDGQVIESRAVTAGGSPGNGQYSTPYRSFGETIVIRGADGKDLRYAHLAPGGRMVTKGQYVKAGQPVGRSGNTGNSSGPHTHYDIDGSYDALNYFKSRGIGLKTGGYVDTAGLANIHDDEVVVDEVRTQKLFNGIDNMEANIASGGGNSYSFNMNITEPGASADDIANMVIRKIERSNERRATRRSS